MKVRTARRLDPSDFGKEVVHARGNKSAPLGLFRDLMMMYVDKHGWPNRLDMIDGELCVVWDCWMDVVPPEWHGTISGLSL
jgi:hypothetical protein